MQKEFKVGDKIRVRKDMSKEEFTKLCEGFGIMKKPVIESVLSSNYVVVYKLIDNNLISINCEINGKAKNLFSFFTAWFEHFDYMDVL